MNTKQELRDFIRATQDNDTQRANELLGDVLNSKIQDRYDAERNSLEEGCGGKCKGNCGGNCKCKKKRTLKKENYKRIPDNHNFEKAVQGYQKGSGGQDMDIIGNLSGAMEEGVSQGLNFNEWVKYVAQTYNVRIQNMDFDIIETLKRSYESKFR